MVVHQQLKNNSTVIVKRWKLLNEKLLNEKSVLNVVSVVVKIVHNNNINDKII